jgi:hypothetical protein
MIPASEPRFRSNRSIHLCSVSIRSNSPPSRSIAADQRAVGTIHSSELWGLSPATEEESAAAEHQHYEDDDEQCVRVHVLSCAFGEGGPAALRSPNARDDDGDSAPSRSGSCQLQRLGYQRCRLASVPFCTSIHRSRARVRRNPRTIDERAATYPTRPANTKTPAVKLDQCCCAQTDCPSRCYYRDV